MMNHVEKKHDNKKYIQYIVLAIVILLGLARITYIFTFDKKGIHSDEVWSYGLANSTDGPYIYEDVKTGEDKNCNEWIDGSVLHDYITVQKGERFHYANVYYNLSEDMHPPLYFWVLHTICSFFPDQYSLWFGYAINMAGFIVMMIFLYKTMLLVTRKIWVSVATVAYFELTVGVLNMMTFVRMYAMGMAIASILIYYHARLYYNERDRINPWVYIALAFWTLAGAMTHHFFLVWAFALAAVFCVYYLVHKHWKQLFAYGGSMLGGALISFAAFPAVFEHIFNSDTQNNVYSAHYLGLRFQYILCIIITSLENVGFNVLSPYDRGYKPYIVITVGVMIALFVAACFVFRKDAWFQTFLKKLRSVPGIIWNKRKQFNWFLFAMICSVLFNSFVIANTVNIIKMEYHTDRYLSTAYVSFVIVFISFGYYILNVLVKKKPKIRIAIGVVLYGLAIACMVLFGNVIYLFPGTYDSNDLQQIGTGDDVLVVTMEPWLLTVFADQFYGVNQMYVSSYDELYDNKASIDSKLSDDKPLYFVLDVRWMDLSKTDLHVPFKDENKKQYNDEGNEIVLQDGDSLLNALNNAGSASAKDEFAEKYKLGEVLDYIRDLDITKDMTYVGYDDIFGRPVLIYRLN